ncbi:MAG: cytochrome oxidase small assembly protein [Rubrivivax sp.]|nr:cytochrome oxidase small assembly protein [Rubrivivax sp.]
MLTPEQHKANRRLGLILASVALTFFLGFVAKLLWGGQ